MLSFKTSSIFTLAALSLLSLPFVSGCTTTRHETSVADIAKSSGITFKVKENLMRDPDINSGHIGVNTYRDTVTLSGRVHDQFQEDKAIEIARNVHGVKYVVDNLVVMNT